MRDLRAIYKEIRSGEENIAEALSNDKSFIERYLPEFQYFGWYRKLDAMKGKYKLILCPPGIGKTTKFQIYTLRRICRAKHESHGEPFDIRIGFLSKSKGKAEEFMLAVANQLRYNKKLIEDFGEFFDKDLEWNTTNIRVKGSRLSNTTPTITNIGASGQIESLRFHILIPDDPVDLETCLSPAETDKMEQRLGIWIERLEPGGELMIIGHRFLQNDFYSIVEERQGFKALILKAYDPATKEMVCPEKWTWQRFKKEKIDLHTEYEIQVHYQQEKASLENCPLKWEWFEGPDHYQFVEKMPENVDIHAYFDPAYSDITKTRADFSAAISACKYREGTLITGIQRWKIASGWSSHFCDFATRHGARHLHPEINNAQTLGNEMKEYITRNKLSMVVDEFKSKGNKEYRIGQLEVPARQGRIWFLKDLIDTDGFRELKSQWIMWPNMRHDDLLDVLYFAVAGEGTSELIMKSIKKPRRRSKYGF